MSVLTSPAAEPRPRPRLGFLGVGWIGRHRLEAVVESDGAEVVAICDPSEECRRAAAEHAADAEVLPSFDALLQRDLDGIVIATPSAFHAEQTIRALERGLAVFCQKPLARTAAEARRVVDAARRADRLLGVDFCYRHTAAARALQRVVTSGSLGEVYGVELVFHNAYGPDKPWFYDKRSAGGGCLMDLGIHLVDLARWLLGNPEVSEARAHLSARGRPLCRETPDVEDYAVAELILDGGAVARLACSWNLPAGRDAVIEASVFGTEGGAALRNVDGSFYDLVAEQYHGTRSEPLCEPPDDWGGRAVTAWVDELAAGGRFSPAANDAVAVAEILDQLYDEGTR